MPIHLKVKGQELSPSSNVFIASGTLNYPEVVFEFDDEWSGFAKIATFCTSNSELYRMTVKENRCLIPSEVMVENENVSIGVYGTKGNVRITTNILEIHCHQSGYGSTVNPSEQTVDLLTQMQQDIEDIRNSYLSKEQFRIETQKFTTQVFGAECHVEYDGNYLNPLNGFRINKSNYKPNNGDVVVIWVNNQILIPGQDYILFEEENYWEVTNSSYITPGIQLTVQIWNIPQAATGTASGEAIGMADGYSTTAVSGIAEEEEEEES